MALTPNNIANVYSSTGPTERPAGKIVPAERSIEPVVAEVPHVAAVEPVVAEVHAETTPPA